MHPRIALVAAALLGATGVCAGAVGAHALKATLEAASMGGVWATAFQFQLLHAVALLAFAGWLRAGAAPAGACATWAVRLWIAGTLLFCGSLYALALGGPHWMGPVTPLGGLALIAGWVLAGCSALAG